MRRTRFFTLVASIAVSVPAFAFEYVNGTVTHVSDGDTVTVDQNGTAHRIRFYGIDTPERDQPFGVEAHQFTENRVKDKVVTVKVKERDQYGRIVGEVLIDGKSLNRELVRAGLAWWYEFYAGKDLDLERLQASAMNEPRGLWTAPDRIAPWDWRRGVRPGDSPPVSSDVIASGLEGAALIANLRANYAPDVVLSYRPAREKMFGEIDSNEGKIKLFYTGESFTTSGIPDHLIVNTEHVWPQSLFSKRHPMKSDLHHLFPVYSRVNSSRGNHPFAEIPDEETRSWWCTARSQTGVPAPDAIDGCSEALSDSFEPREGAKGDVARALLYFYVIYANNNVTTTWLMPQLDMLQVWHDTDPPDDGERQRTERIDAIQGNMNPFVLDPTLFERVVSAIGE